MASKDLSVDTLCGALLGADEGFYNDTYLYVSPKQEYGSLLAHRLGYDYSADPCDIYNSIYLRHTTSVKNNSYNGHQGGIREEIEIKIPARNVKLLEKFKNFFNKTLLSHGNAKTL